MGSTNPNPDCLDFRKDKSGFIPLMKFSAFWNSSAFSVSLFVLPSLKKNFARKGLY